MRSTALCSTLGGACLALLACLACGPGDGQVTGPPDGARLFVLQGCNTCHKIDGSGGPLGPPLRRLADNWTREQIADYLADPKAAVEANGRLKSLALNYRMPMPPVRVDREQRLLIADHVLQMSGAGS